MDERKLTLSFVSDFKNVDLARAAIQGICEEIFGNPEWRPLAGDFTLAATEAMNNAVEHSGSKCVEIDLEISENEVSFKMMTEGQEFDPTIEASMPALSETESLPQGGFGLSIIQQLADSLQYEYLEGKNILTVKKMFPCEVKGKLEE